MVGGYGAEFNRLIVKTEVVLEDGYLTVPDTVGLAKFVEDSPTLIVTLANDPDVWDEEERHRVKIAMLWNLTTLILSK